MLQPGHRTACAAQPARDLVGREPEHVAQDGDVALVGRERVQSVGERGQAVAARLVRGRSGDEQVLGGDRAPRAQVVDGDVVGDAQDPAREGQRALLVARDRGDQLGEQMLGEVLGLVLVADDAVDVAADVPCVAPVEERHRLQVAGLRPPDSVRDAPVAIVAILERLPANEAGGGCACGGGGSH